MSLKDALLKAGLTSSKSENHRERKREKDKKKVERHQETRNFCEVCELTQPDVERYKHRNALIDAEWICSNCADKNQILDDFRQTHQSEFAKTGRFRRYYGPTKDFKKEAEFKPRRGPHDGNRGRRQDREGNRSWDGDRSKQKDRDGNRRGPQNRGNSNSFKGKGPRRPNKNKNFNS